MRSNSRKSNRRIAAMAIAGTVFLGLSLSAWAYKPWDPALLTTYYDASGNPVGIEATGNCGFSLIGSRGVTETHQWYQCGTEPELPF